MSMCLLYKSFNEGLGGGRIATVSIKRNVFLDIALNKHSNLGQFILVMVQNKVDNGKCISAFTWLLHNRNPLYLDGETFIVDHACSPKVTNPLDVLIISTYDNTSLYV